jgi:hypothetical protein
VHARHVQLLKDHARLHQLGTRELSAQPNNPAICFEIATLLTRVGEEKAAQQWFLRTLKLRPNHPGARKGLAIYFDKIGKRDLADKFR